MLIIVHDIIEHDSTEALNELLKIHMKPPIKKKKRFI